MSPIADDLRVPAPSLVLMVGPSSSGKSTFARRLFDASEIVSLDSIRKQLAGSSEVMDVSADAFGLARSIAESRLKRGLMIVIDALNLKREDRAAFLKIADRWGVPTAAIVMDTPRRTQKARASERGQYYIDAATRTYVRTKDLMPSLEKEFTVVHAVDGEALSGRYSVVYTQPRNIMAAISQIDVIGDIHGCYDEFVRLVRTLGYHVEVPEVGTWGRHIISHPDGRRLALVGDIVDRGPDAVGCLSLAIAIVGSGGIAALGNHDSKFFRYLSGTPVQITNGLDRTIASVEAIPEEHRAPFIKAVKHFLRACASHYVLDEGKLVVTHAGIEDWAIGRDSRAIRAYCMYGPTTGQDNPGGQPARIDWAPDYKGDATVVYGHTPVDEPRWVGSTIDIDTGAVFGGNLTALRWPSRELVSIKASAQYAARQESQSDSVASAVSEAAESTGNDPLSGRWVPSPVGEPSPDVSSAVGRRIIAVDGRLISIRPDQAAAAFEHIALRTIGFPWLAYVPPTTGVAPCTSDTALETLEDAFDFFRDGGVGAVSVQQKHMGSRAVVVVARDQPSAKHWFRSDDAIGAIYSKNGFRFFDDPSIEARFLNDIRAAIDEEGLWASGGADWMILDGEMLPWRTKGLGLITNVYAATAAATTASSASAEKALERMADRGMDVSPAMASRQHASAPEISLFRDAYRRFATGTDNPMDATFAPFRIVGGSDGPYTAASHDEQMAVIASLCARSNRLVPTRSLPIDLRSGPSRELAGMVWDAEEQGEEGYVVKREPLNGDVVDRSLPPSVKVRTASSLRLIFGPSYRDRLAALRSTRNRSVGRKNSIALRQSALSMEAVRRLAAGENASLVAEAVHAAFAVALQQQIDPSV